MSYIHVHAVWSGGRLGKRAPPRATGHAARTTVRFFFSEPRTYVRRGEGGEIMYLECEASTALDATSSGVCRSVVAWLATDGLCRRHTIQGSIFCRYITFSWSVLQGVFPHAPTCSINRGKERGRGHRYRSEDFSFTPLSCSVLSILSSYRRHVRIWMLALDKMFDKGDVF